LCNPNFSPNFSQKFDSQKFDQKLPFGPYPSFSLADFPQRFDAFGDAPLVLCIQKPVSNPKGSFYSIFCEKIV